MWISTQTLLKKHIFHSDGNQYISELKNARIKYTKVSANNFLEYLWKNHASVDITNLDANEKQMK